MFFDVYYLILVLPAVLLAMIAQVNVQSTFKKYSQVHNSRGLTGAQTARAILDRNGLHNVPVERVSGNLSDHYDPKANVVRLSESTYSSTSVGAVGVAAHEVGHAIQYAQNYVPIRIRSGIIPISQLGSSLTMPLVLLGFLLGLPSLVYAGIILFTTVVVFQLVTLPVEFNASRRALAIMEEGLYLTPDDLYGARKVLNAAAMTYVAALFVSLMNLLRLVLLAGGRRRR